MVPGLISKEPASKYHSGRETFTHRVKESIRQPCWETVDNNVNVAKVMKAVKV